MPLIRESMAAAARLRDEKSAAGNPASASVPNSRRVSVMSAPWQRAIARIVAHAATRQFSSIARRSCQAVRQHGFQPSGDPRRSLGAILALEVGMTRVARLL